jgi:hypothetical protein
MVRSPPPTSGQVSSRDRLVALCLDLHGVELRRRLLEPRVRNEDFLIAGPLDLNFFAANPSAATLTM